MSSMFTAKNVILSVALSLFVPFVVYADVSDETTQNKLDPAETGYDFISEGIYYKILQGDSVSTSEGDAPYTGKIVIPDEVVYDNKTYKVTKVSGFINSPEVTEITIPKYTEIISGFYGADAAWEGGPGIKSVATQSETEESVQVSKLTKVYFNAENCQTAYYSYSQSTMLGGGYYGYQTVFPATVTSVEFGENVTRVPNGLLIGCSEITELTFPKSVKYIGWKIIEPGTDKIANCQLLCEDLQEIGWLPDNTACVTLGTDFHTYPCGMEHGVYDDIPTGMKYDISQYSMMFHNFVGLDFSRSEPVELPSWVENLAPNAFGGCKVSFKMELPETLTTISENAFANCKQLEEITIPSSVTSIESSAFSGCTNLKTLYFNSANCEDAEYPYPFTGCASLNNVEFGEGVTRIPANLFNSCVGLTEVKIPESVAEIGEHAFAFSGLVEITIPKSVSKIGKNAFLECGKLTKAYYNAANCQDANSLFYSCDALEYVEFGATVIAIPNQILLNRSGVTQIVISNSVQTIGECAFYGTGISDITIPASVEKIGQSAFYECENLKTIYFNAVDCELSSNVFGGCESLSDVEFGESVSKIPDYIFLNNNKLGKAIISESVKEIGARAFESSGLTEVAIPASVEKIGTNAFKDCASLKSVYFNATDCSAENAFYSCSTLENIDFGETVTKIPSGLMGYCDNMVQLTIPEGVTEIGGNAFLQCNNLATLYFNAKDCDVVADSDGNYDVFVGGINHVEFGESVTKIPNYLLYKSGNLADVKLPESLKEIGMYAFYGTGIINIVIPNMVTAIGSSAFEECWMLASVTIGESVETIGSKAFYILGGNEIKTVISMNATPPQMPLDAFFTNTYWNATLSVPTGATTAYQEADSWKEFRKLSEVDFSGIEDVEVTENIPAVYFNLQGVEVENPQNGMFIKRQGKKVSKVVIN